MSARGMAADCAGRSARPAATTAPAAATLLRWRLAWYSRQTFHLAARRAKTVMMALALVSPLMMPLFQQVRALGAPARWLLATHDLPTALTAWLATLAVAISWSSVQSSALQGGSAWAYLRTLPGAPWRLLAVDLLVLAIVDLPLFLPAIADLVTSLGEQGGRALPSLAGLLALNLQWPVVQLLARERPAGLATVLAGQAMVLVAMGLGAPPVVAVLSLLTAWRALAWPTAGRSRRPDAVAPRWLRVSDAGGPGLQLARIGLRRLLDPRRPSRHLAVALLAVAPLAGHPFLLAHGMRADVARVALALVLVPLVLAIAGYAQDLRALHAPMAPLLQSLGPGEAAARRADLAVASTLGAFVLAPLATVLARHGAPLAGLAVVLAGLPAMAGCAALNQRGAPGRWMLPRMAIAVAATALVASIARA